jgi:cytochrome c heme-lyase
VPPSSKPASFYSLDTGRWHNGRPISTIPSFSPASQPKRPKTSSLSTAREISTIPRAISDPSSLNSAEKAALPDTASHGVPANAQEDTGHDRYSGNWIYPSQEQFFNAMKRKGHEADPKDMDNIVPIHNAVNERAWGEIKKWEQGWGAERCGGPKLVSFAGNSKALTPRARYYSMMGYSEPFDRHDWVVDRCGKKIEYVIDFYQGKGGSLSFFLDTRPKLNSFDGVKMRVAKWFGI